jgi:hypothetical protein
MSTRGAEGAESTGAFGHFELRFCRVECDQRIPTSGTASARTLFLLQHLPIHEDNPWSTSFSFVARMRAMSSGSANGGM